LTLHVSETPLKRKIDLTEGSILKKILIVAVPTLLTSLMQMTYNLVDIFFVSRVDRIGLDPTEAVAGVGTAAFYTWFGMGVMLIVKIGVSVYVSQAAGRNDKEAVDSHLSNGLLVMVLLALFYSLAGYFFRSEFVGIFNIENTRVVGHAEDYLAIVSMFMVFIFVANVFNGVYDGLGKTINTFYIMAAGLLLNIVLDPLLILWAGLGVQGAAIATVIAQGFTVLVYLFVYASQRRPAVLAPIRHFSPSTMKRIVILGLPVGIQSMAMATISIIVGIFVASFGEAAISVSRIGSQIEALSWMIALGFQVAISAFVGQNYGAMKIGRIKQGYLSSMRLLVPYGITVSLVLFFFAEPLFALFIDEEPTLAFGAEYLRIISISQLFMILELVTAGAFNGLGKTVAPSGVGIVGNIMRIPFAYGAATMAGIWWTLSATSVFKGLALVLLFVVFFSRLSARHRERVALENYRAL